MEDETVLIKNIVTKLSASELSNNAQINIKYPLGHCNNVQKVIFVNISDKIKGKILQSFVLKALGKTIFRNYFVNCFKNELALYTIIFPELVRKNAKYILPECIDAEPTDLSKIGVTTTYIVLENLCEKGFKMSMRNDMLKQNEILCALSALGHFHGDCYSFKMFSPQKYNDAMLKLVDVQTGHGQDEYHKSWIIWREVLFYHSIEKYINMCGNIDLLQKAKHLIGILHCVGLMKLMKVISKPKEPLSVLCHGDINRSNIMFQYSDDNELETCAFIDFQLSSVSSPSKDLFSLIFLNIKDNGKRRNMWNEMWCTYWASLVERISENNAINVTDLPSEFSMKSLQEDFNYNSCAYLPNIICFIYSYYGNKMVVSIHKEHVETKKQFIEKCDSSSKIEMKNKFISQFDYDFYVNLIENMENDDVKVHICELLQEFFTYYFYQYPVSLFDN